jgi:trans-2,3-dihydro-3-hydroxyanthranilate isomerase
MGFRYITLDVFTDKRFTGNPLAVVFEADALEVPMMQATAREFNFPETVFVLRPSDPAADASIRIFTPATELPFAGHPTVGAAIAVSRDNKPSVSRSLVLQEKIGLIRCAVDLTDSARGHARFSLPKMPEEIGPASSPEAIAFTLGLHADDIGFDDFTPARWSAGIPFTFVPVRNIEAVKRCQVDLGKWDAAFETGGRNSAFVFSNETIDPQNTIHARMFAPRLGIAEDPATGGAAAAFAGFYARAKRLADGEHRVRIEQGYEMERPSLIEMTLLVRGGGLAAVEIGGTAIVVCEGTIEI